MVGLGALVLTGCGAGPYGHSRSYTPLDEEREAVVGAAEFDPVMADRKPREWQQKSIMFFGIVIRRTDLENGTVDLALSLRRLEGRNLCSSREESSCRTTVSDREHHKLHAVVRPASVEDEGGELSLGPGSLVRVVGSLRPEVSAVDELEVVDATYYRHWPRGYYVTSAKASVMRK